MRFLLDENLEHEVYHRLQNYGHDLLHVEVNDELSKGDTDEELAEVSRTGDWIIVTYDGQAPTPKGVGLSVDSRSGRRWRQA